MKLTELNLQGARQCAPVLAGIKVSNLLILDRVSPLAVMQMMDGTGLSFEYLYSGCSRKVWLVYWLERLEELLQKPENRRFLREPPADLKIRQQTVKKLPENWLMLQKSCFHCRRRQQVKTAAPWTKESNIFFS